MAVLLLLAAGSKTVFEVALTLNSHISIKRPLQELYWRMVAYDGYLIFTALKKT